MRMKRIMSVILSIVMLSAYMPGMAFAADSLAVGDYSLADNDGSNESEEFKYQNLFYYKLVDGELHITKAVNDEHFDDNGKLIKTDRCLITSLIIPQNLPVNGVSYPVKYIDSNAFSDCENLTVLEIPSSVISIESGGFRGCISLTKVTLPEGLETLGCGAFQNCKLLSSINVPAGCKSGKYAGEQAYPGPLYNTPSLSEVKFEDGITTIDNAFFDHSGITSIDIPDSVTSIGSNAFRSTKNLRNVSISADAKLESIGWTAFSNSAITDIYLPDTVSYVDVGAFSGCKNLEKVRVSAAMTCNKYQINRGYDTGIFNGCTSLTEIIFPDGLERIGDCWFFDSPIESVTIPNTVKEIGANSFRYCLNLEEVLFSDGWTVEKIGSCAFRGDAALTEFYFPNTLTSLGSESLAKTGLVKAELPSSLKTMYAGAFNECKDLTEVFIPAGMKYSWGDDKGAFEGCNALKTIKFEKGVTR